MVEFMQITAEEIFFIRDQQQLKQLIGNRFTRVYSPWSKKRTNPKGQQSEQLSIGHGRVVWQANCKSDCRENH